MEELLNKISSKRVLHIVLALGLLSSLFFVYKFGRYIALLAMVVMVLLNTFKGKNIPLLLFFVWAMICSILNGVWGQRDILWAIVMLAATPMLGQSRVAFIVFKALFRLLPFFVISNLIAYLLDINVYYIFFNEENQNKFCFSGLTLHPQWLGAFSGIACVYFYYLALINKKDNRRRGVMAIIFFVMSVELGLLAGSRAALLAAGITIVLMTMFASDGVYDFLRRSVTVFVLLLCFAPIFMQSIYMIEVKQFAQDTIGMSRAILWHEQFQLIKDSPFFGIGLVGRETGNGWLAVASNTGVVGALFMIVILFVFTKKAISALSGDGKYFMPVCVFIYLCIHSCFEGYILSPGYLCCYIFWSCIGIILSIKEEKRNL